MGTDLLNLGNEPHFMYLNFKPKRFYFYPLSIIDAAAATAASEYLHHQNSLLNKKQFDSS
jgi:hypothetical protein